MRHTHTHRATDGCVWLEDVCVCAGNDEMEAKMREGVTKLRRGIVFAASLYL